MAYYILLFIIFVIVMAGLIISYFTFKLKREEYKKTGKYPAGHYMGNGLAIGMGLGIIIAFSTGEILMGYMTGLILGTLLGSYYEKKHEFELRPLTPEERELRKKSVIVFGIILIIGILASLAVIYLQAL